MLRTGAAEPGVGTSSVISVMSLPGTVAGSSAADEMQSHAFILAGRLALTSAVFPKSNRCFGSDLRRLETFRAQRSDLSGGDDTKPRPPNQRPRPPTSQSRVSGAKIDPLLVRRELRIDGFLSPKFQRRQLPVQNVVETTKVKRFTCEYSGRNPTKNKHQPSVS